MDLSELSERIRKLEESIREIELSWPAHNPSPAMFAELEELESELERLQERSQGGELNAEAESSH
jgi:HAMP domain-containing protein